MKVLVFLAAWKRPEITEVCFAGIQRLRQYAPERFDVSALAVISEESMVPLCKQYGINYFMHANRPLGRKKNAGLNQCFRYEWDYLLEIGSDDLLRNEVLDIYEPYMKGGYPLFGMKSLVFMNSENGEARHYDSAEVYGMGRCMSRDMLQRVTKMVECEMLETFVSDRVLAHKGERQYVPVDKAVNWERCSFVRVIGKPVFHLWGDDKNQGMDQNSNHFLMQAGVPLRHIDTNEPLGMDIKSSENIWKYNPDIGKAYDPMDFLKHCSEKERELIESIVYKEA